MSVYRKIFVIDFLSVFMLKYSQFAITKDYLA